LYYVYLIESFSAKGQRYVGMTTDLKQRLLEHNAGKSPHTSTFRPWRLTTYIAFAERPKRKPSSVISNPVQATHSPVSAFGSAMPKT
jgi:hypothetical protein